MSMRYDVDVYAFARSYLSEMRNAVDDTIESWQQLDEWVDRDPELAWQVLVELTAIASVNEASRIGAGPLEELLVTHESFARRAAELAANNEMFKSMLSCVTTRGMSAEMQTIIREATE